MLTDRAIANELVEDRGRFCQCYGAHGVGRASLMAVGRRRPFRVLDRYPFDSAATGEMGWGFVEPVPPADKDARSKWGVALVARQRQIVGTQGGKIDAPMGGELRAVDGHAGPVGVGHPHDRTEAGPSRPLHSTRPLRRQAKPSAFSRVDASRSRVSSRVPAAITQ